MKKRLILVILILLLIAIFVSGCWLPIMPEFNPPPLPELPVFELPDPIEQEPALAVAAPGSPGQFTLRYEPELTMNPILTLNRDNISLSSLLYENLFVLDENLIEVPLLVREWYSEDNETFTLHIHPDILMHDGELLTAADVTYSINQARQRGRHVNKLRTISSVSSDGELTVTITISAPNARFVRLLDIPVIRSGTIDERIPPGSGPFIFPHPEAMRLIRFRQHRYYEQMPLSTIHLRQCSDGELTGLFDEGFLSLLWDDPTGAFDIRINRMHEPRYFETTSLQFLGFNASSPVLRDSDVRRAIGSSINRQYIVENIMNIPRAGQTVASPLAISPMFDMYDPDWEPLQDPIHEMSALIDRAGLLDYNYDGFFEMPDGFGGFTPFTLDLIVNVENSHKIAAAEKIAEDLRLFGIDVNVRTLPWAAFIDALAEGNFDIYYGEVQLGADFDLSPLLLPGDNSVNFGGTASTMYASKIQNFLAASTQEEMSTAGRLLVDEIRFNAPFVPILYKRHAIYTPTGVVTGATPSQSGVFHNFHNWSIDLIMLAGQ
ncbi:MAG: ABC transporter substrate-binding protein [Oscillospiraceae bacterium]|nr:ABC transporter substrate-binding protein [Oscillospiraceae bacterium]MCL2277860.1 ABC transporter substrate-binding protein [Oscillospiraceae bacterium]